MKTTKKFTFLSILTWVFFNIAIAWAASIDHFEVTISPTSANISEALDVTIEAVDKNNETVPNYDGTVIVFSETDKEAEFPNILKENTYTFTSADEGKVKFENAVKFKNAGKQSIHVYDLNDDTIMGMAEVDISQWTSSTWGEEITIISPESGITLGKTDVVISGTTKKNHRVVIVINNKEEINTTSNSEWVFEKEITLSEGESFIKAQVLDADNKKIGESENVNIKINSTKPILQSIKVSPKDDVEPESPIAVELISNQGLSSVNVILDDVITALKETREGIYKGTVTAPKKAWKYDVDVVLKDDFWNQTKETAAVTISVIEELNSAGTGAEDTATWETQEEMKVAKLKDPLRITGIKLTVLKTKSILTWDKNEKAESYNIYKKKDDGTLEFIQNVKDSYFEVAITGDKVTYDYFAIKWVGKDSSWENYEGDLSEATKLQTGPEILILFLLALFGGMGFVIYKRKYS